MSRDGFQSGDIVNRRVSRHIRSLLPEAISAQRDYHFEGQRALAPDQIPGKADTCLCYLEVYVGANGQFETFVSRRFDYDSKGEWQCTNRISRRTVGQDRSLDPFEYKIRTALEIVGQSKSDRSRVDWETLGSDPIFGGREAQAATLLAEKMAHRKAREGSASSGHHGSLSHLGSLSNVIDNGRQLRIDWSAVDALLGPDAETIASSAGFEQLQSDEKRRDARQMGVDFLSETLEEDLAQFEKSLKTESESTGDDSGRREPWTTLSADMDPTRAKMKINEMQKMVENMRNDL